MLFLNKRKTLIRNQTYLNQTPAPKPHATTLKPRPCKDQRRKRRLLQWIGVQNKRPISQSALRALFSTSNFWDAGEKITLRILPSRTVCLVLQTPVAAAMMLVMGMGIVHYEYMALAKKNSVLREAMLPYSLNNSKIVPHRVFGHISKPCYSSCFCSGHLFVHSLGEASSEARKPVFCPFVYIHMYIYIYICIYIYTSIHIYIYRERERYREIIYAWKGVTMSIRGPPDLWARATAPGRRSIYLSLSCVLC